MPCKVKLCSSRGEGPNQEGKSSGDQGFYWFCVKKAHPPCSRPPTQCISLAEESDGAICPRGEDPWLCGVEGHIQNTQISGQCVPLKHLDGYQQWVLQQVTVEERDSGPRGMVPWGRLGKGQHSLVHHAMADNNTAVI